jgi:hypothetical protein
MGKLTGATTAAHKRIALVRNELERSSHMHRALLGLAATAAFAALSPAQGQSITAAGFSASAATRSFSGRSGLSGRIVHRMGNNTFFRNCRGAHCRHIHVRDGAGFILSGYDDPGDYDANRSFDPDRWNDWWHERPERAFPRWMRRNQDCARQWYSGDVLTC